MAADFNLDFDAFINSSVGAKLSGKKDELSKLASSPEGQNVRNMLRGSEASLMAAIEKGDTEALKKALSSILKTEDGSRVAEQILKMIE